ncbi:MAG: ABC transporter substrate-binding protein, partial [Bradymonadaceae bacterium]
VNVSDEESKLSNPKLAQALGYAVDREKLVEEKLNGVYNVASSFIPKEMPNYAPQFELKHNPEKAKKLLKEVGHPNGKN